MIQPSDINHHIDKGPHKGESWHNHLLIVLLVSRHADVLHVQCDQVGLLQLVEECFSREVQVIVELEHDYLEVVLLDIPRYLYHLDTRSGLTSFAISSI